MSGITITLRAEDKDLLLKHLQHSGRGRFCPGWISAANPSPSKVGFYLAIQTTAEKFYPDFHNLPFCYGTNYKGYMNAIKARVQTNGFPDWQGHCSPLPWEELTKFITCLSTAPI